MSENISSCLGLTRASVLQIQMAVDKAALLVSELDQDFFDRRDMKLTADDRALILNDYSSAGIKNEIVADYIFQTKKLLDSLAEELNEACAEAKKNEAEKNRRPVR